MSNEYEGVINAEIERKGYVDIVKYDKKTGLISDIITVTRDNNNNKIYYVDEFTNDGKYMFDNVDAIMKRVYRLVNYGDYEIILSKNDRM